MQVLFIGNSFTYFNDMPFTFLSMIRTIDPKARVDSLAYGGYTLSQYADEETEVGKIAINKMVSYDWDYIVLQEQSLVPCLDPQGFAAAVKKLCTIVHRMTSAKVILYQTWAYKNGSEKLASTGMSYEEMNTRLREAYRTVTQENQAILAPVGDLFAHIYASDHITHLINRNDNYHPSASGSYLAACVIFKTITGKTTIGLPCPASVSLYNLSVVQKVSDTMIPTF